MATYKTSTIRLYSATPASNWELLPHKLFVVEDIEAYLATKTSKTVTLIQYQKPQLELEIKLDLSQTYAEPLNESYKYVRLENSDDTGHYYYYFVKNVEWRAKSAVRFVLVMDVLNTFKEGTHYAFKANTKITREHKDRFLTKGKQISMSIATVTGGAGTLDEGDTVVCRNMNQDNLYMFTGVIVSYDQDDLTLEITDDLSRDQIATLMEPIIQYNDLMSVTKDGGNYIESYFDDYNLYYTYFRNIDYVQENINPVLQCGSAEGVKIEKASPFNVDWYLLYRNQNDPDPAQYVNPVECYLIPSEDLKCNSGVVTGGRVRASYLEDGKYYYFFLPEGDTVSFSNGFSYTAPSIADFVYVLITKTGNKVSGQVIAGLTALGNQYCQTIASYDDLEYIAFDSLPVSYAIKSSFVITSYSNMTSISPDQTFDDTEGNYNTLDGVETLLREDAKNIKLIKLPYCPYDFTAAGGIIQTDNLTEWDYATFGSNSMRALKLKDLNTRLRSTLSFSSSSNSPLNNLVMDLFVPSINNLRKGQNYESKLFNSEFYRGTYVYDSFQFAIQLEKCEIDSYLTNHNMKVYFDVTRTINSKFLFTFDSYHLRNATESYAKYMPIARNNEEVLYNVPYINYVKSGFNYDIKAKNVSNVSTWVGAGLSAAGVVASLAMPSVPLKALGVVTSLISLAMTTKSAVTTVIQNEQSIERKLKEASMQTASVAGSDDVDLMSVYAENRLKYLVYEPNAIMKQMLYDLFFYAGYASNRLGIPTHNNRVNFDYLECDAVIDKVANIPDDCLTELVNSFKYGVTYIHKTTRGSDKWDFEQKYENWEVNLL